MTPPVTRDKPALAASPAAEAARAYLRTLQRRHAYLLAFVPAIGALATLFAATRYPVGIPECTVFGVFYSASIVGVTVGFHRLMAHGAFKCSARTRMVLAILGSMSAQGTPLYWATTHRRHHASSDRPGDPHSPNLEGERFVATLRGLWHAQMTWIFDYEHPNTALHARDLLQDKVLARVNRSYPLWVFLGLLLPAVIVGLWRWSLSGVLQGFLWGGLFRMFVLFHFTSTVNSLCHRFGSRPFATRDRSGNLGWLAIPTFGESWHNNHHAFPASARIGLEWWQVDLGGTFVRVGQWFGWIWDVKSPRRTERRENRNNEFTMNDSADLSPPGDDHDRSRTDRDI